MKYNIITLSIFLLTVFGCVNDDFLDRYPQTSITEKKFFNNITDLETYTNGFYSYLSASTRDYSTDDQTRYSEGDALASKLKGTTTVANVSDWWSWTRLRNINYFLEKYKKAKGSEADINHYVGMARYFRARFYISKLGTFGKAPWYGKTLKTSDEDLLYKGHDTRDFVAKKIVEDLQYAIANMKDNLARDRVSKWAALAELARYALIEASMRKYHSYLNLSDANTYYDLAIKASKDIMDSGKFSIYSTGKPDEDYNNLFKQEDYSSNNEVILQLDRDQELEVTHQVVVYNYWGLSKTLADSYLMTDGTKFTEQPGFDKKTYATVFDNRDPRMKQTFMYPGYMFPQPNTELKDRDSMIIKATYGGYTQQKFLHDNKDNSQWSAPTDQAVYRYAEILLIHAEAKAERGTLTQADIDATIKLIRDRVKMPNMNMVAANFKPDAVQENYYPNVTGANKGVILEIRRERRVELACEGFRYRDMVRWACGATLARAQVGMYVPGYGAYDVTGDGKEDIAILEKSDDKASLPVPDAIKNNLVVYAVNGGSFSLSQGDKGFIQMNADRDNPKSFIEPKYYYYPIKQNHLVLNPKLTQPHGW